jgi:hypothetical protein
MTNQSLRGVYGSLDSRRSRSTSRSPSKASSVTSRQVPTSKQTVSSTHPQIQSKTLQILVELDADEHSLRHEEQQHLDPRETSTTDEQAAASPASPAHQPLSAPISLASPFRMSQVRRIVLFQAQQANVVRRKSNSSLTRTSHHLRIHSKAY